MKKLTAIITPTWNNEEYTTRCFDSIRKNTKDYKIIWIDNGSTEESRLKVKNFLDKNGVPYELILNKENIGFVKATNQGMKRAVEIGADYVVLQNNDTEVYAKWLDRFIEIIESDSKIGLVGPITSPCESWQSIDNLKKNNPKFINFPVYNNPKDYSMLVSNMNDGEVILVDDYLAFFCTLIKREVINELGYLSEDFGVGLGDDNDYCMRARKGGWQLALAKNVFVFHNHRTTFKSLYSQDDIKNMQKKAQEIINEKNSEDFLDKIEDFIVRNDRCPYCGEINTNVEHIDNCRKKAPLISVVIPSRIGEEVVSLKSLNRQTYKNLEIIVEYDEKKEGASVVRNRGANKANGKYLFFCDNDLTLSPNCISDLYLTLIKSKGAKWVFGKFYIDGNLFNEGKKLSIPDDKYSLDWVDYFFCISTMSLIDIDVSPIFDEEAKRFNDWDLWLGLSRLGYSPVFCNKVLFATCNRKNGISKFDKNDFNKWKNRLYMKYEIDIEGSINKLRSSLNNSIQEIENKDREIYLLKNELMEGNKKISDMTDSLRWKIPNYFYKLYKKKIKKFVPRKVFIFVNYVFRKINELGRDLSVDDKLVLKWKSYFLKNKNKKIVLFVDRSIPEYDKDAGSFIAFQYLKILKELNYHVIFWPQDMKNNDFYARKLNNLGIEVMLDNFSPYFFVKNFGKKIDIAMLSRPAAGNNFVSNFRKYSNAKIVYIGHDLHYLRESRAESVNNKMLKGVSEITKKNEFSIMKNSDISLFFSDKEVSMIKEEDKSIEADVIPWIEDIHKCSRDKLCDRKKIVFLGGFSHLPNEDAVKWFHDYIYPELIMRDFYVTIIGSNVPDDIKSFATDKFEIRGYVEEDDLFDIFEDTRVFIAPLRFGAGFKGKIAKAMSCGLPVVTTDIGAEGIGLIDGENAMIANTAELFAKKIENILVDDDLWLKLSKNSIKHIRDNYSTENGKIKMENLLMK